MSKRIRSNGCQATERRLAQGRGQGRGSDYRPWLQIQDVPSCGCVSRILSPVTRREHHLLSGLERNWFLVSHAQGGLRDYREQYPLLPLEETLEIARSLGVDHPLDPRTREPVVITTDFLMTIAQGPGEFDFARAIKPAAALASRRVLEKLELERVFWKHRHIDWAILTERELPAVLLKNMRWLFPCFELLRFSDFLQNDVTRIRTAMQAEIAEGREPLIRITMNCDAALGLKPGTALLLARYFIVTRAWPTDLNEPINPRCPLRLIS